MSKNTRNRILLTALAALLLVTLTIGGTMAWLTATTDEVTNTFEPASITVDLKETLQSDGETLAEGEEWSAKLVPGAVYDKDPQVALTQADCDAYLFVKITNNSSFVNYVIDDTAGWDDVEGVDDVYYRATTVAEVGTYFNVLKDTQVTIDGSELTTENMPSGSQTLVFEAYAVQQAAGTPAAAWALVSSN